MKWRASVNDIVCRDTYYTLFIELNCFSDPTSCIISFVFDSSYVCKDCLFGITSLTWTDLLKFPPSRIFIEPVASGSIISNKLSSNCVD